MVAAYILLVLTFYHDEAHWTGAPFVGVTLTIVITTAIFSLIWYGVAWFAALSLGVYAPLGFLLLVGRLPIGRRHAIVQVPDRADTPREVWGRFVLVFLVALGYELLFMIILFHRGLLSPHVIVLRPELFFFYEGIAGVILGVALAASGPYFASRVRLRIADSLPFPFVWLTLTLLVIGGTTLALLVVLPGIQREPLVFFLSILIFAPAAWFVALGYSRAEWRAQNYFLARAWPRRGPYLHFGDLEVRESDTGAQVRV
jgi:hypothetical protein